MPKYAVKIKLTFLAETIVQVDKTNKTKELTDAKLIAEAATAKIARQNLENKGSRAPMEFRLAEMKTLTVGTHTNASIKQPEPLIITDPESTTISHLGPFVRDLKDEEEVWTSTHSSSKYPQEYQAGTDREAIEYCGADVGHLFLAILSEQFELSNNPLAASITWLQKRWDRNAIHCDKCYWLMGKVIDEIKSWED